MHTTPVIKLLIVAIIVFSIVYVARDAVRQLIHTNTTSSYHYIIRSVTAK